MPYNRAAQYAREKAHADALAAQNPSTPEPAPGAPPAPQAPAPAQAAPGGMTNAVGVAPPWLSGSGSAAPGMSMGTQQPWAGGPGVTMTSVNQEGMPALDTDFSDAAQRGADAAYAGATQYFDEDFGRDRAALESRLSNQGFAVGSEAYNDELSRMERGQNAARANAAYMAQGVGHNQSGALLMRALQSRGALMGERERNADRIHGQSMGVAGLGLGARGQEMGRDTSMAGISASAAANANAANAQRYGIDTNRDLTLRRYGMEGDQMDFNQLMQLIGAGRGGVNMPNFGSPQPLDVGSANQIASGNANAGLNRSASDRMALAQLGGAALSGVNWNNINWGGAAGG